MKLYLAMTSLCGSMCSLPYKLRIRSVPVGHYIALDLDGEAKVQPLVNANVMVMAAIAPLQCIPYEVYSPQQIKDMLP